MTPTEISEAYAALHERWPELMTRDLSWDSQQGMWYAFGYIGDSFAHAACFLACLKACAERDIRIRTFPYKTSDTLNQNVNRSIWLNHFEVHTITEVMDRVMQLPKENT